MRAMRKGQREVGCRKMATRRRRRKERRKKRRKRRVKRRRCRKWGRRAEGTRGGTAICPLCGHTTSE